jgi:hypothetical protein
VSLCFAYPEDARLALPAIPKDLKKVLNYAAWLKAATYVVSDFRPAPEAGRSISTMFVSSVGAARAGLLPRAPRRSAPLSSSGEAESEEGRKILDYFETIAEPHVVCYYSGHATNKSLILPDGSKLSITALHQRFLHAGARAVCWILDACELSGRSLRLPFLCAEGGTLPVRPHGLHFLPTIALSSDFRPAAPRGAADDGAAPPEGAEISEPERGLPLERRTFITDDGGSLFTSALLPLLMQEGDLEWHSLLGELSRCCGFRDGVAMCLTLQAYVSDAGLTHIPFWMRNRCVEPRGTFWIVRR